MVRVPGSLLGRVLNALNQYTIQFLEIDESACVCFFAPAYCHFYVIVAMLTWGCPNESCLWLLYIECLSNGCSLSLSPSHSHTHTHTPAYGQKPGCIKICEHSTYSGWEESQ